MSTTSLAVRVRAAPSPTGYLHIGNLRSIIFNWLFAKHNNGNFLIRIEDTDTKRSKKEYSDSIISTLKWFSIESDEQIVFQSDRFNEYKKVAQKLMSAGLAYPCFCQPKDSGKVILDLESGATNKYNKKCRDKQYNSEDLKRPHAIRFKLPGNTKNITFDDLVVGTVSVNADQLDDFVIIRQDCSPTYNFCVVVDDIFMRITHVIRGQDHISNTPKQILFYNALKCNPPIFAHIPLITGTDCKKLSKRDKETAVEQYKLNGFLPEAIFNYLLRLGWAHKDQEIFSIKEAIEYFKIENVCAKSSIFDPQKLIWLNSIYIKNSSVQSLCESIKMINKEDWEQLTSLWNKKDLLDLIDLYKAKVKTVCEIVDFIKTFANDLPEIDLDMIKKWQTKNTKSLIKQFIEFIRSTNSFTSDNLYKFIQTVCKEKNEKIIAVAQPIRVALTGSTISAGIFELMQILGPQRTLSRLVRLVNIL